MSILLGFEVPSGKRVDIPEEGHAGWFGQTQLSGKTTTFEAIVSRGGFRAVAFITKQGEGSFLTGRLIPPYFSEPTNDPEQPLWRWVQSILEASQNRKLRFEESWIIRACEDPRQAHSLGDVYENIKALLTGEKHEAPARRNRRKPSQKTKTVWTRKPVSGMNAGVYTSLKAYFDIVMPQLRRLPFTKKLVLRPGLNVMDLREYSMEMQALVIRSVIEHVYLRERNVRVIIPEAQDFVPQGKNTPVKMACETLVRKGAALKNFMWLDSQDMAAVEKVMLRAVSILGCGVQGEMHEINRAIEHMLGGHITSADIARLPIGHFFVRLPGGDVKKVYVQPAWMDSEAHAQAIARGQVPASSARVMLEDFKRKVGADAEEIPEQQSILSPDGGIGLVEPHLSVVHEIVFQSPIRNTTPSITMGKEHGGNMPKEMSDAELLESIRFGTGNNSTMSVPARAVRRLLEIFDRLVAAHDALAGKVKMLQASASGNGGSSPIRASEGNADTPQILPQMENIYEYVKGRALKESSVLMALLERPTIDVQIKRVVIQASGDTMQGKLARLIAEKFFDAPREFAVIRQECLRRGFIDAKASNANIAKVIGGLVSLGFLTAEATGYQSVPGMKIHIREV